MEKHTQTQTLVETNKPKPKKDDFTDSDTIFIIFIIIWILFFLFSQSWSSWNTQTQNNTKLSNEEKQIKDKIKSLEHSIKSISIKKREIENELRKLEMDGLLDDKMNSYDLELKIDKLKIKYEEIEEAENKKYDELYDLKQKYNYNQ